MSEYGYTLRSGGADGADSAFEKGCDSVGGYKDIFLPWPNFNNNESNLYDISPEAYEYVKKYHPYYNQIKNKKPVLNLHARNTHQVLGRDLKTPSRVVICWAEPNKGGTQQAILIANLFNIPVFNLYFESHKEEIKNRLK